MKYSKQLPLWLRNGRWSIYIKMNPVMKKFWQIDNFESFCKMVLRSDIYKTSIELSKHRPKLK